MVIIDVDSTVSPPVFPHGIAEAECMVQGANRRFVLTNLLGDVQIDILQFIVTYSFIFNM